MIYITEYISLFEEINVFGYFNLFIYVNRVLIHKITYDLR